jgi:hypothetical protein
MKALYHTQVYRIHILQSIVDQFFQIQLQHQQFMLISQGFFGLYQDHLGSLPIQVHLL